MHADPQLTEQLIEPTVKERPRLGTTFTVALCLFAILALYWRTTASMVAIWERSETFAHGFIVVPLFLYLLWRERDTVATLPVKPYYPAVFGLVLAGIAWLAGELAGAVVVPQFAMMAMVPLAIWTVLGTRVIRSLAFPLAFLFFAVPFGELFVPKMMDWTADFTIFALRASGVPVYREGNFFMIPTGMWSVIEACSGIRYLIASLMIGCLYSYLSYRSPLRRGLFIAASVAVPIVANWLRAYLVVMLAHLTNNRLATGIDHVIYGWIFFGVVMALLFWVGSYWREEEPAVTAASRGAVPRAGANAMARVFVATAATTSTSARPSFAGKTLSTTRSPAFAFILVLVIAGVWQLVYAKLDSPPRAATVALSPLSGQQGWTAVPQEITDWRPDVIDPAAVLRQVFVKDGVKVGVYLGFYRQQNEESKAITTRNQLVRASPIKPWREIAWGTLNANVGGDSLPVKTAVVSNLRQRVAVWQWYWIDGHATTSDYLGKLYQILARLKGHGDPSAWVIVYTSTEEDEAQARGALQSFVTAMRAPIDATLAKAARE